MSVEIVLDQERQLERLQADYDAARPYIERLKQCFMSMNALSTLQTASPSNSHQERDLWTGQGAGIGRCMIMLDQHYRDDKARLENECMSARAAIDAQRGENQSAGKPDSRGSNPADDDEDDDEY